MFRQFLYRSVLFFLLISVLGSVTVHATHIVGGEMTYVCLGNDNYQVTMTVYRDCQFGIPNFDNPAHIGVFDSNNQLISTVGNMGVVDIPYIEDDTLQPVLFDSCLVVPPDVCVDVTTYMFNLNLPFRPGGYRLAYQRCCRNQSIVNIIDPGGTGATYGIDISEDALLLCNTSPTFREWPPIYICVNEPITFDHGADDAEGDSLVYSLCTPFSGGTADPCIPDSLSVVDCFHPAQPCGPIPCPPSNPPFDNIFWSTPYDVDDMLGGIPLSIDPETGFMTGTPNTIGQFVVGVCMEEYRDGVLLSTTRRDFQYNIGVCGNALSSFFAPEIICEGLTVDFDNQSDNANDFEWYFNDPADPDFISFDENPTYTFSDTGDYNIVLIAEPGSACVDTFEQMINLQEESLFAVFDFEYANCTDSLTIEVADLSFDTIFEVIAWDWQLTDDNGDILDTSNEQDPVFVLTTSTQVTLQLVVTAENGCTRQLSQTFPANIFSEQTFPDEISICTENVIELNPDPFPGVSYTWSPSAGLNDPNSPTPLASPDTTTTYVVFIENIGDCNLYDTITVVVDSINAAFTLDIPCDLEVFFTNESYNGINSTWIFDFQNNPGETSNEENPSYTYSAAGTYVTALIVDNGAFCRDTSFVVFTLEEPDIQPAFEFDVLGCVDSFTLAINDLTTHAEGLNFTWQWYLSENGAVIDSFDIQNPTITVFTTAVYTIELIITDENGCSSSILQNIPAQVFMTGMTPDASLFCEGDSTQLNPSPLPNVSYSWSPAFGLSDPSLPSPWTSTDTTYIVMGVDQYGCVFNDTVEIVIDSIDASFVADVPCDFEVLFTNTSYNAEVSTWYFNDPSDPGASSIEVNPTYEYSDTGMFTATLIIEAGEICVDTAINSFFIDQPMLLPAFDFEVLNCTDSFTLALTDESSHLGGLSFEWTWTISENNQVVYTFSEQNPEFSVFSSNDYTIELEITDSDGCSNSVSQVIPTQIFTEDQIPDVTLLCVFDSVQLNPDPLPGVTYTWSPADGLSDPDATSPMALPETTTTYEVIAVNQYGCTFTDMVTFSLQDSNPILDGFIFPDTIFAGDTSEISTTFLDTYTYTWQFTESLSDLTISNPLAFPLETTTYTLDIVDENGCTNSLDLRVVVVDRVCEEPNIFLPNAFSPNGDGENDVLRLLGNGVEAMELVIYNRWGQKVFESFDQQVGWDGTFKGKTLPPDAYGFYLKVLCVNQEEFFKKGNITLLR